jgi:hypothetical protein
LEINGNQGEGGGRKRKNTGVSLHRLQALQAINQGLYSVDEMKILNNEFGYLALGLDTTGNPEYGMLSKWCDVDHALGRLEAIFHCILFTTPCSHELNSFLAHVRRRTEDWKFGPISRKYNGGN